MKMRLAPKIFVLVMSLCLCKGAPPKKVGTSSNSRGRIRFTEKEDKFIIDELLNVRSDYVRMCSKTLWEGMQAKHREKWKQNTPGFPCDRTVESLRKRLTKTLIHNYPHVKVKVPEALLQRFPLLDKNKPKRAPRNPYTPEETDFIVEELMKPSCKLLHASSTWETIKTKHDEKRKEGCHGFKKKRTAENLRGHMIVMKQGGLLPNEVARKLRTNVRVGSSSRSTEPEETTEAEEINEYEDDDAWADDMIQSPINIEPPNSS